MQDDMKKAMPRHLDLRIEYFVVLSATNAKCKCKCKCIPTEKGVQVVCSQMEFEQNKIKYLF